MNIIYSYFVSVFSTHVHKPVLNNHQIIHFNFIAYIIIFDLKQLIMLFKIPIAFHRIRCIDKTSSQSLKLMLHVASEGSTKTAIFNLKNSHYMVLATYIAN